MTIVELHARIHCWLWLDQRISEDHGSPGVPFRGKSPILSILWREQLRDIATLEIPSGLEGTPVANKLRIAIRLARTGNRDRLAAIASLLLECNGEIVRQPHSSEPISAN